jgi:methionyl-tRNA formyltransferase
MTNPSVIFMGSKPASVVALRHIVARGWDVKAVCVSGTVSHPWYPGPNLSEVAEELGLPIFKQSEIPETGSVDLVVSYMFRHLVKPHIAKRARIAAVNFHAAPLPEYGGWGTYNLAILENKTEFGCTCHHLGEGFDDGPIVKVRRFEIAPETLTGFELEKLAQSEMLKLFAQIVQMVESGEELPAIAQPAHQVRYHSLEEFLPMKRIPDDADAETADRYARAFWFPPYEGAYIEQNGVKHEVIPAKIREQLGEPLCQDVMRDLSAVLGQAYEQ